MRLSKLLWRKYTLGISPNSIKVVLRRHGQRRRAEEGKEAPLRL